MPIAGTLVKNASFRKTNCVAVEIEKVIKRIGVYTTASDVETLATFAGMLKQRLQDDSSAAFKQYLIAEVIENVFRVAMPKLMERLGIVYTPVELVDFIIHSVDHVYKKEFGKGVGERGLAIIDPFGGTGTFTTRLLQVGIIPHENIPYKYQHDIWLNEYTLLGYYMAAVNIENTYAEVMGIDEYVPFPCIVWTDTFQSTEDRDAARKTTKERTDV
jgi:predicted helicase